MSANRFMGCQGTQIYKKKLLKKYSRNNINLTLHFESSDKRFRENAGAFIKGSL